MDSYLLEGDLDEEKARRSILVSNIPDNWTYKDVIIYFQRERNGGGEVDSAMYLDPRDHTTVVVTFDEPTTVETAVGREHKLGDNYVTVKRYPIPVIIPEVFVSVQARVNPCIFSSSDILCNVVELLQRDYGVECRKSSRKDTFCLTGSMQQITQCHEYILETISKHHQDTTEHPTTTERKASPKPSRSEKDDEVIFQTVPIILKFMFTVPKYRKQLVQIEKDNDIRVRGIEDGNKVLIQALPSCTHTKFEAGCDQYIELYQMLFHESMMSKEVVLTPGQDTEYFTAQEAINKVQPHAPVIIEKTAGQDTWLFYGEENEVKTAIKEVCTLLNINQPLKRAARKRIDYKRESTEDSEDTKNLGQPSTRNLPPESAIPGDRESSTGNDSAQVDEFLTKKGFRISVRLADITEEKVDVIVNCNDEYLQGFSSGLPKDIVDKGGMKILMEVEAQTKSRKRKPGEIIVTGGERLPCSKIMHVITWNGKKGKEVLKNFTQDTCFDCLRKTQSRSMRSIAFPAVGAGQKTGMTLPQCATAMINAVEKYMTSSDPKINAVADIRFVHLDSTAFEVFREELKKRYGAAQGRKEQQRSRPNDEKSLRKPDENLSIGATNEKEDVCPICLEDFTDPVPLAKCKHRFCRPCIDAAFKHRMTCPTCGVAYGVQTGNMPHGTMYHRTNYYTKLPGHESYGTIEINYHFSGGTQGPEHPNPGQWYTGTSRTAYLPDSPEGREVLSLLKKAFEARLTFTVGTSVTTGARNTVTWNDIHHKTSTHGGPTGFGYPDPGYLKRVKEELAAKGIS